MAPFFMPGEKNGHRRCNSPNVFNCDYLLTISIAPSSSTTGTTADSHNSFHPYANSITRVGSSASTKTIPFPVVRSCYLASFVEPGRNWASSSASVIEAKTSYASGSHLKSIMYTAACVALQNNNVIARTIYFFILKLQ